MFEPHQFERDAPLKNQRENSMNTIKNAKIENITCNGNVAYLKTRTNKRYYCLLLKNSRRSTKTVNRSDNENFYLPSTIWEIFSGSLIFCNLFHELLGE